MQYKEIDMRLHKCSGLQREAITSYVDFDWSDAFRHVNLDHKHEIRTLGQILRIVHKKPPKNATTICSFGDLYSMIAILVVNTVVLQFWLFILYFCCFGCWFTLQFRLFALYFRDLKKSSIWFSATRPL